MFTSEEIQELSRIFGITPVNKSRPKSYTVSDGFVYEGDTVWWHCDEGPEERVVSQSPFGTLSNLIEFPQLYSIKKPKYHEEVKVIYTGEYED